MPADAWVPADGMVAFFPAGEEAELDLLTSSEAGPTLMADNHTGLALPQLVHSVP